MNDDTAEPVCRIEELEPADAFLVQAFRNWAVGLGEGRVGPWVAVWEGFRETLGDERAPGVLERFENLMNALRHNARRTIHFHAPGCPCVDADEATFVELLARLDAGADRRARTLANAFVHAPAVEGLLERGRELATELRRSRRHTTGDRNPCDASSGSTRTLH